MKVIILFTHCNNILNVFKSFDEATKSFFNTTGKEQVKCMEKAKNLRRLIEKMISEEIKISNLYKIQDEDFYEDNINSLVIQNRLMNGLYNSMQLKVIIKESASCFTKEGIEYFQGILNDLKDSQRVLFWNTGEENIDEILEN